VSAITGQSVHGMPRSPEPGVMGSETLTAMVTAELINQFNPALAMPALDVARHAAGLVDLPAERAARILIAAMPSISWSWQFEHVKG